MTQTMNFKRLSPKAVPLFKADGNAGYDLTATSKTDGGMYIEYGTDIAVAIPEGFGGFLFPRSSVSNYGLILANCVGVVDSSYRGEIKLRFKAVDGPQYKVGERVGQLVLLPILSPTWAEVEELPATVRGFGGFGSTGK